MRRQIGTIMLTAAALLIPATVAAADGGVSSTPHHSQHRSHRCTPSVPGMRIVESERTFDETWETLIATLDGNPNIGIVATLDHATNAESAELELPPTREVFFGNPALGTPIMQASQTAGIDLPQKILVWEARRGRVFVGYNEPAYVARRHDARDAPTLDTIAGALANITAAATGTEPPADEGHRRHHRRCGRSTWAKRHGWFGRSDGLVTVESAHDADTTFERLVAAIEAAPPNILFTLEHDRNAAQIGLDLAPTKLIVFGNPVLGTPLMQRRQTIGIDLPQKFLVWEDADGTVRIAYNDPYVIARRHRVGGERDTLDTIAGALAGLSAAAAAPD